MASVLTATHKVAGGNFKKSRVLVQREPAQVFVSPVDIDSGALIVGGYNPVTGTEFDVGSGVAGEHIHLGYLADGEAFSRTDNTFEVDDDAGNSLISEKYAKTYMKDVVCYDDIAESLAANNQDVKFRVIIVGEKDSSGNRKYIYLPICSISTTEPSTKSNRVATTKLSFETIKNENDINLTYEELAPIVYNYGVTHTDDVGFSVAGYMRQPSSNFIAVGASTAADGIYAAGADGAEIAKTAIYVMSGQHYGFVTGKFVTS